jgi:ribosome biogenesis GTPase
VWLKGDGDGQADLYMIEKIFTAKSIISRKKAGEKTEAQVMAANIDIVFIVMALDGGRNYNLRALERYAALAWESGAVPVVLLNKADLCPDYEAFVIEAEIASPGVKVIPVSAAAGNGLDQVVNYLKTGVTAVFIGPSGAGKSTLTNILTGAELQSTGEIRENDKRGRHTTSSRSLLQLSGGAVVIDTPGLREIQLWGDVSALDSVFTEIDYYSDFCKFSDCSHTSEPGCAVIKALEEGNISYERYESYTKLRRELEYLSDRQDQFRQLEKKQKWKSIAKQVKLIQKIKRPD